jgi:putative acetyltransferase
MDSDVIIVQAERESEVEVVRGLWREYWESFGLPMDFQGFGEELRGLPGLYGEAGGLLLLAICKDQPAGTIALRRLDASVPSPKCIEKVGMWGGPPGPRTTPSVLSVLARAGPGARRGRWRPPHSEICSEPQRHHTRAAEVKRLFLWPEYRGRGLGRRLLEAVMERGAAMGYEILYADTLPSMTDALSLYQRAGFERIEAYSSDPTPGAIYMKRELVKPQL